MKLYFEDTNENSRLIAECQNETEVIQNIHKFVNESNKHKPKDKQFKIYYTRTWTENGKTWYDVGSYSEFFYVTK